MQNLNLTFISFVKSGKERVVENLRLTVDKMTFSVYFSSQYRTLERKQKETNPAGGEADELIVMTNNGLFCDTTARDVHTFITQLLSE